MARPITVVPINSIYNDDIERNKISPVSRIRLTRRVFSKPKRCDILGANSDRAANANKGRVVTSPICAFDTPVSLTIVPINGLTDVLEDRKLEAIKTIPKICRMVL